MEKVGEEKIVLERVEHVPKHQVVKTIRSNCTLDGKL